MLARACGRQKRFLAVKEQIARRDKNKKRRREATRCPERQERSRRTATQEGGLIQEEREK